MFQKETESNDPTVVPSECCRLDWMVMKFCGPFAPIRWIWWKRRDGFSCSSPVHSSSSWHDGVRPAVYWSTSFLVIWLERNSQSYYKKIDTTMIAYHLTCGYTSGCITHPSFVMPVWGMSSSIKSRSNSTSKCAPRVASWWSNLHPAFKG